VEWCDNFDCRATGAAVGSRSSIEEERQGKIVNIFTSPTERKPVLFLSRFFFTFFLEKKTYSGVDEANVA